MARRKRASKSPSTSSPAKKERPKELEDPAATVSEAPEAPHDQGHPAQHVPQDVPQDFAQYVPQDAQEDAPQGVQPDISQDVPQDVPQEDDRDLISISNATNSPLLRLPAEIRNMIFSYVYIGKEYDFKAHIYPEAHGHYHRVDYDLFLNRLKREACLSFVCRQLNAETSLLPYKFGTFGFWIHGERRGLAGLEMLEAFLMERTDEQIDAITQLKLEQRSDWKVDEWGDEWRRTGPAVNWIAAMEEIADYADQGDLWGPYGSELFDVRSIGLSGIEGRVWPPLEIYWRSQD